jgi:hypothetical protein
MTVYTLYALAISFPVLSLNESRGPAIVPYAFSVLACVILFPFWDSLVLYTLEIVLAVPTPYVNYPRSFAFLLFISMPTLFYYLYRHQS